MPGGENRVPAALSISGPVTFMVAKWIIRSETGNNYARSVSEN
jgi:hypothetical protein